MKNDYEVNLQMRNKFRKDKKNLKEQADKKASF